MHPQDATYGLMVLLKGKVKLGSSRKAKFKIFTRKSRASKTLTQRKYIAQKERRVVTDQELMFVSFCLTGKRKKFFRT